MKCAGTSLPAHPCAGRFPSRAPSARARSTTSSCSVGADSHRICHGVLLCSVSRSAAAAAEGDLDFLPGDVELAVGLHQRVHVRGLAHLDARADARLGAGRDRRSSRRAGSDSSRPGSRSTRSSAILLSTATGTTAPFSAMSGAVIDDVACCRPALVPPSAFSVVGDGLGLERRLVPVRGQRVAGRSDAGGEAARRGAPRRRRFQGIPASMVHVALLLSIETADPEALLHRGLAIATSHAAQYPVPPSASASVVLQLRLGRHRHRAPDAPTALRYLGASALGRVRAALRICAAISVNARADELAASTPWHARQPWRVAASSARRRRGLRAGAAAARLRRRGRATPPAVVRRRAPGRTVGSARRGCRARCARGREAPK